MPKEGRAITEITQGRFVWLHAAATGPKELDALRRRFKIPELDLRDIPPPTQRPKAVLRDAYVFVILLFPYFDRSRKEILITEVDFFIGRDFLVTVNQGNRIPSLARLADACARDPRERRTRCAGGGLALFTHILEELLAGVFPMLVHVGDDIDNLEQNLFDVQNTRIIHDILRVKTNVTNCRRAMTAYKSIIERLNAHESPVGAIAAADHHRLIDMTKEIWNLLESHRETLSALQDTNMSLLTMRTNETMRVLTVFSVLLLPLTLIVGIFGMNVQYPALIDGPYGPVMILGLLAIVAGSLILFFRDKKWL